MDVLTIRRGLVRHSSPDWQVRLFLSAPGVVPDPADAPELRHAGLYLPFGRGLSAPVVLERDLPLFGEGRVFPATDRDGSIFLTSATDAFDRHDLEVLCRRLFEAPPARLTGSAALEASVSLFHEVLADAFHDRAA